MIRFPRVPGGVLLALWPALVLPAQVLDVAGLAKEVAPCADFYAYANRKWQESVTIPADRSSWGSSAMIEKRNTERLEALLAAAAKDNAYPAGSNRRKAVDYYASGMDEVAIAKAGLAPVAPLMAAIEAVKSADDLPKVLATLHKSGVRAGFAFTVRQDAKDSRRYLAEIQQAGLGLPDRDYYFRDDDRSEAERRAYLDYFQAVMGLAGEGRRAVNYLAGAVIGLERLLAEAQMTLVERRDPDKVYNKRTLAELSAQAPGFDWPAYFAALDAPALDVLNVAQPGYASAFARLVRERPIEDWRAYLRWQVLNAFATKLPRPFEEAHFVFFQRTLAGVTEPPPRAKRVIEIVGGRYGSEPLGQALGEIYVADAFPPEAKKRALDLVNDVKAALRERLATLDWMEDETRKAALDKLDRMAVKIGYPDTWRDLSAAEIDRRAFAENWRNANAFEFRRSLAKLGKAIDRGDWWMAPHVVNAYYGSSLNEIVFPAGILQPPYFDAAADDAVNFGGIGMVIGHEITHGFDDRGRRFDAEGNLRDWWTPADRTRYRERAQAVVDQYSAFTGVGGLKVNATLTLGENIADLGGLRIAYLGLQRALERNPTGKIDDFTPQQRFFLAFAQGWRSSTRPEQERLRLLTDSHSPPRFRVQGPLANVPEFAQAFSCGASDGALRTAGKQVTLW